MAGTGAIYRIDSNGENEASASTANEIIEFNTGAVKPDTTGNLVATSFRMIRDVSPHPNPKRALTKWQDNLLGTMEVTITGYFTDHDSTTGPGQFKDWQEEAATNSSLEFGRFGLRIDDSFNGILSLNPTATSGYILVDVQVFDAEAPRDEASFIATLVKNGAV